MQKFMKYFRLYDAEKNPNAEQAKGVLYEDSVTCKKNEGHLRAGKRIGNLIIKLPTSRIRDFVWTWYSDCIITDKVTALFRQAGFTGYELRQVTVAKIYKYHEEKDITFINGKAWGITKITRDRKPIPIPPLWELVVIGKGGDAHPKSGIKIKYECKSCGLIEYTDFGKGLYVDEAQWDGSDFFTIWPLPKFILVTERVKNFVEENKLTNCIFTPIEELIGEGKKGSLSPGPR